MKKSLILGTIAAVGLWSATQSANATLITGEINMSGLATLNSTSLATATADVSNTGVTVIVPDTGSFSGLAGTSVTTFNGFAFSGGSATPLWSFVSGGWTYSFNLGSDSIEQQNANFLSLIGSGTLNITGAGSPYTPTLGTWSLQLTDATGGNSGSFQFGFTESNNSVPDGGTTMVMLGGAFCVIGAIRRKLA